MSFDLETARMQYLEAVEEGPNPQSFNEILLHYFVSLDEIARLREALIEERAKYNASIHVLKCGIHEKSFDPTMKIINDHIQEFRPIAYDQLRSEGLL